MIDASIGDTAPHVTAAGDWDPRAVEDDEVPAEVPPDSAEMRIAPLPSSAGQVIHRRLDRYAKTSIMAIHGR